MLYILIVAQLSKVDSLRDLTGKVENNRELQKILKLDSISTSQLSRRLRDIELCKVIAYVKLSAKVIEKAQFMIEILSIILQDESDAEASIILKEGLYEPESPHQKTSCRSTGRARTIKLCRKHTQHLPKILQPVDRPLVFG